MRKNGSVVLGGTEMYYAAFGEGPLKVIVLPGLSDGLATVIPLLRVHPGSTDFLFICKKRAPFPDTLIVPG